MGAGVYWVVMWSLLLGCATPHLASGGRTDRADSVVQLFEQAVSETGEAYFAAKRKILAVEDASDTVTRLVTERKLGWRQRLIAAAIREQQEHPAELEALTKRLALLALFRRGTPHHLPREFTEMWSTNPKTLAAESEAKRLFEALVGKMGLLAEVILKHSPDTIAEIAAATRLAAVKALPEGRRMTILIRNAELRVSDGNGLRLVTTEELVARWPPRERRWTLLNARRLAGRALVLVGNEDAVSLLEEMGKDELHQHDAVECLEWIGTEAATQALKRHERRWWPKKERFKKREAEIRKLQRIKGGE